MPDIIFLNVPQTVGAQSFQAWAKLRQTSDFGAFAPSLAECFTVAKEFGAGHGSLAAPSPPNGGPVNRADPPPLPPPRPRSLHFSAHQAKPVAGRGRAFTTAALTNSSAE